MRRLAITVFSFLTVTCGGEGGELPPPEEVSPDVSIQDDQPKSEIAPDVTQIVKPLWNLVLPTGGATSHLARSEKGGIIYATGSGKVYAVQDSGNIEWTWPDDDDQMDVPAIDAQIYTPAVGKEGILYMGTGLHTLLAVNKNGSGRFSLDLDGDVTGAPAIPDGGKARLVVAATDAGSIYTVKDLGQLKPYVLAKRVGDKAIPDPLPGTQPIVAPVAADKENEVAIILGASNLYCFNLPDLYPLWTYPLPEGRTATSNPIMLADKSVLFATGAVPTGEYYEQHFLLRVDFYGNLMEGYPAAVDMQSKKTAIISLSQGIKDWLLLGTNNAGLVVFDMEGMSVFKSVSAQAENFMDVAQPVQGNDGLIYFNAFPSFIYVLSEQAEVLWYKDFDELDDPSIGAQLAPSSPLVLMDGTVVFHAGNFMYAVKRSDAGPSGATWPRFGGNDFNTGNFADPE